MIRSLLFRALNRCDAEFPRYERAMEVASTVTAVGLYCAVTGAALVLTCVVAPAAMAAGGILEGALVNERCGAGCAGDREACDGRPS